MMEYKRLTRKDERGFYHYNCTEKDQEDCLIYENCGECYGTNVLYRLAELEDKIEQGTLIELPCEIDSEIYIVDYLSDDEEKKHYYIRKSLFHPKWIDEWRNMFFLTREEAEKRLKELQNGQADD